MAHHVTSKLKDSGLRSAAPGTYYDGGGLMLKITARPDGGKARGRWLLRTTIDKRRSDLGLGSYPEITLAAARAKAHTLRQRIELGENPLAERKAERALPSFEKAARLLFDERKGTWKNEKHAAQWIATLETHVFPLLGAKKVSEVGPGEVRDALAPIWTKTPETARRVRQRISMTLDFALSKGWRTDPNPVAAVAKGLPRQTEEKTHFAALPYAELPAFLHKIRACGAGAAVKLALEFLILTAARSGEVRGALWSEISDLDGATPVWTLPPERMKAGRLHRVPLSPQAVAVLRQAQALKRPDCDLIFPSTRAALSDTVFTMTFRRMENDQHITTHGFRSSFRDWAAETTATPPDVVEAALAHAIRDKTVAAYLRTDHFDKRTALMREWAQFVLAGNGAR